MLEKIKNFPKTVDPNVVLVARTVATHVAISAATIIVARAIASKSETKTEEN